MFKIIPPILAAVLAVSCASPSSSIPHTLGCSKEMGKVSYRRAPTVINVSEYDPKETQRRGRGYSPGDQSALRAAGTQGLIARCGKGRHIDIKCAEFLAGAERQGFLLGTYYYLLPGESAKAQASRYIRRLRQIKASKRLSTLRVLLVADIHSDCSVSHMVRFVSEIERLTGVVPVIYLENSPGMRARLRSASSRQKAYLRRSPYWLALYTDSHTGVETPLRLAKATGVWDSWCMWQYGGVSWKNGRSQPKHYQRGSWKTPRYLSGLDRPAERNGFNGSNAALRYFWDRHSWAW